MTGRTETGWDGSQASPEALRALARTTTTTSVPIAGRFLGIGVNGSYDLIKCGEFPVPVLKLGKKLRVPVADLARVLGISLDDRTVPSAGDAA